MNCQKKIILASGSPRRKELLSLCGVEFEIEVADIDESINSNNPLEEEIKGLAIRKAKHVFDNHQNSVVIGADTIVVIDNEILGKPKTNENAKIMLNKLQDKKHKVITGCAIVTKDKVISCANVSTVTFSKMSDQDIQDYIDTKEPLDKAGAYGIQGIGSRYIEKIDGDYYSIMGLPVNWLYYQLKEL